MLLAEPLEDRRIVRVRLRDELLWRRVVLLLAPVNRYLRLRQRSFGSPRGTVSCPLLPLHDLLVNETGSIYRSQEAPRIDAESHRTMPQTEPRRETLGTSQT